MDTSYRTLACATLAVLAFCLIAAIPGRAQTPGPRACNDMLPTTRTAQARAVGPASCMQIETTLTVDGRRLVRLDVGLDGSVEGYLTTTGDYKEYLTNAPDLVFGQTADPGPILFAVARYERAKGAAMTIVLPEPTAWNGKMFVTVHGRGRAFKDGSLRAWDKNLDPEEPARDLNKYDRLMLAKGFALVKTHRTSSEGLGEIVATLEDGTTVDYPAFNDSANYIKDFTAVARAIVERRLGRAPRRTYFYGHSAGARIGRGLNYTPGLNRLSGNTPVFDGLLLDDGAAGGWLPVRMENGRDVLLQRDADTAAFVPQLDISHQMYNNIWPSKKADYMSSSYLANKRQNARILREKGLTPKHRMYEVRSISHSGGESFPDGRRGELHILDLSRLMDRFIDHLDAWVDQGIAPPPSRSDWLPLGDTDGDGQIERPGLVFPEVACPLGVYYPFPTTTAGTTAFAAFTGEGLEPLDQNNVFADMNRNGVWDDRETPTAAWQRLGLLKPGERLTRERYVACVTQAAEALEKDGFFSPATTASYVRQAGTTSLQPK